LTPSWEKLLSLLSFLFFFTDIITMKKYIFLVVSLQLMSLNFFAQGKIDSSKTTADSLNAIPVISLTEEDVNNANNTEEDQNISGLLQSSRDPFMSTAGFVFGAARYKVRGYQSGNTTIYMNGIEMNDPESGGAYWSTWGGLNDATRFKDTHFGIVASPFSFTRAGGYTNIDTRASLFRKGINVTYSAANRSYRNRVMLTYATGMMKNNWAFTVSGSHRWSQEGYVEGSFYDAYGYFLSAEKKINDRHSLNLTVFGAPTRRGKTGSSTQEVYDLTGNHYYNPYWGYQNGEKRNSRISNYHKPYFLLNHYFKIDDKTTLTTGISYSFGRGGSTSLNWYDGARPSTIDDYDVLELSGTDPRPDYYRYLPSYYQERYPETANQLTTMWQNDKAFQQINWDYFYFSNSKNLFTVHDVDGETGKTVTGNRSNYIVEDRRNDHNRANAFTSIHKVINDHIVATGGLRLDMYKGHHFKVIDDLLGGDYWLDVDKYAERDFKNETALQTDLNHPNHIVKVGDVFGYDYITNVNKASGFAQAEFSYDKLDYFAALTVSNSTFWRTGNMKNGLYPTESEGDSKKLNFTNFGVKGGATYKITGRHYLQANVLYETHAPYARNAFISPRINNRVVEDLKSETQYGWDLNYIVRYPFLKARLTVYCSKTENGLYNRSFYHDVLRSFVNYVMTDVSRMSRGAELGFEANVSPTLTWTGMVGKGQFLYASNPIATITVDNSAEVLAENRKVYLENYHIGGTPQTVASTGLRYRNPKYWQVGVNVNYFGDMYIMLNPDRRTSEALEGYIKDDPQWAKMLAQEKLANGYTLDFYGGKSWKVMHKYYIYLNVSVNNLLDNTDLKTGGYEQLRYDASNIDKFPTKYFYLYGRTYFVNVRLRF